MEQALKGTGSNREKILIEALRLFNESGSSQISTNHICEACKISPGNLYYHFKNKEEIIVELLKGMIGHWDQSSSQADPSLENLTGTFELMFEFMWEYRFIHREISPLYHHIPEFRQIFEAVQQRRLDEIHRMIKGYIAAGIMVPMEASHSETLSRTIWFFALYWMSYLETEGKKISRKSIPGSLAVLRSLIEPYLKRV